MNTQPEALRLADAIDPFTRKFLDNLTCTVAAAELRRLHEENARLKTVMVAAAEEIAAHWDAHCDEEGYGPANLMHRLEKGIPAQYGYKAGDFARLQAVNSELLAILKSFSDYVRTEQCATDGAVTYSTTAINHWAFLANDAIIKHGGQP